ncbi:MAG: dicarboxylate/amino acid:cation symporter [Acidobacteria bacterium]|nr:dicarboxylate/amino acid:cation symporter [Acidobacteriota bacterium]
MPNPAATPWYRQTHWRILAALVAGLAYGVVAALAGWSRFTADWITPFGTIFLRLLLLIAVPLVLGSLVTGIASLADLRKLSRIGGQTITVYIATTFVALVIGLVLVNVIQPGASIPESLRTSLQETYETDVSARQETAGEVAERSPLQPLVDMVPENVLGAATNNRGMLSVVFVAFLFGVALLRLPRDQARPLLDLFASLNATIIKIVEMVLVVAPAGVFALIAGTITSVSGDDPTDVAQLIGALGLYCLTVLCGLLLHAGITYPVLLRLFTPIGPVTFFRGVAQAQLVAFSTSSSAATLPVTMRAAQRNLGVSEEVASFVLPLGATINMDGTAVYMAVAAVFIAQTLGIPLDFAAQATIVFTALLASIGTAAVPSAGIVMLVIVLEAIGVPSRGIALILGVDRLLDMCRTATNVTGDAAVAAAISSGESRAMTGGRAAGVASPGAGA